MAIDPADGAILLTLGFLVGGVGTLIGAGGGFVLVPLLLLLDPALEPRTVTAISLAVVCANALSGSIAYARLGRIDYAAGGAFAVATLPGAVLGVYGASAASGGEFRVLFGAVLLALGGAIMRPGRTRLAGSERAAPTGGWDRRLVEASGEVHEYTTSLGRGVALSVIVGFVASLLGIGGGVVHVPALVLLLGFPVHVATATSHFTLVFTALAATCVHVGHSDLSAPAIQVKLALLVLGVLPGAQVGARLATRVQTALILRLLGAALALVGLRLFVVGLRTVSGP